MPTIKANDRRMVSRCVRRKMISSSVMKTGIVASTTAVIPEGTLLGPEHASVIDNENQRPEGGGARPFSAAGSWNAPETHPGIECEAGYKKTNSREKKRRDFMDSDANR